MFGWTWVYEYDLFELAEAPRSMVPASLVRMWRSQPSTDYVSATDEESEDDALPPARSPSPAWSDDEARATGVMRSV